MSEEKKSGGCAKALAVLAILGLLGTVACAAVGTYLYLNWEKLGLPGMEELQAQAEAAAAQAAEQGGTTRIGMQAAGGSAAAAATRPVVASAPFRGTAAAYAAWTRRDDVLVLVDYYADW